MRARWGMRKAADTVAGYVLVAAGLVMLVTPGPGIVTIVAGLAVLARHYRWADRVKTATLVRIRDASTRLRARRAASRRDAEATRRDVLGDPADEYDAA